MRHNVREMSENLTRCLIELHSYENVTDRSRELKSVRVLYEQGFGDEGSDAVASGAAIKAEIEKIVDAIDAFAGYIPPSAGDNGKSSSALSAEIKNLTKDMPSPEKLSSDLLSADVSDIKNLAQESSIQISDASKAIASMYSCLKELGAATETFLKGFSAEELNLTFGQAAAKVKSDPENWGKKFVDITKIDNAVKRSLRPPKTFEKVFKMGMDAAMKDKESGSGWAGKFRAGVVGATKFLMGAFGEPKPPISPELVAAWQEFIRNCSFNDFRKLSEQMKKAGETITGTAAKAAGAAAGAVNATAQQAAAQTEDEGKADDKDDKEEKKVSEDEINKILNKWALSLKKPAQNQLTKPAANFSKLRDSIKAKLESADEEKLEEEVAAAIDEWITDNKDKLQRSRRNRRVSDKELENLKKMVPDFVQLLKKEKNESGSTFTKEMIRRFVYRRLDRMFQNAMWAV